MVPFISNRLFNYTVMITGCIGNTSFYKNKYINTVIIKLYKELEKAINTFAHHSIVFL